MANTLIAKSPHKLSVYLKDVGETSAQFAERPGINVHRRTIDRYIEGTNFPGLEMAQRIHVETDGYVSLMDWPTEFIIKRRMALRETKVRTDKQPRPGKGSKPGAGTKPRPKPRRAARAGKVTTST